MRSLPVSAPTSERNGRSGFANGKASPGAAPKPASSAAALSRTLREFTNSETIDAIR